MVRVQLGVWHGETLMQRLDGERIPISQVIVTGRDAKGDIDFYGVIVRDITEIRLAEEEIQERDLQFRVLVEGLIQGILVVGKDWSTHIDRVLGKLEPLVKERDKLFSSSGSA